MAIRCGRAKVSQSRSPGVLRSTQHHVAWTRRLFSARTLNTKTRRDFCTRLPVQKVTVAQRFPSILRLPYICNPHHLPDEGRGWGSAGVKVTAAARAPWFCSKGVTAPTRRTYLALVLLAAGSRFGIVAVLGAGTLAGRIIRSRMLRRRRRLWRRLAGSASPLGAGDGLRARRNSLHIHLHLPIHWRTRQKRSPDLTAAPAAAQLPVARMARRGGDASRAPSLPLAFARAPRSSARRSAPAPAAPARGARAAGGRASSEQWPSGAPGSPAKPSASRRRRQRRLPAARPAPGPPEDSLPSWASRSSSLSSLSGVLSASPLPSASEQSYWKNNRIPGTCRRN